MLIFKIIIYFFFYYKKKKKKNNIIINLKKLDKILKNGKSKSKCFFLFSLIA